MMKHVISSMLFAGLLIGGMGLVTGCASTQSSSVADEPKRTSADDEIEVGYGTMKRGDITGAVSTVPVEESKRSRAPAHLSDLIEGNAAGVQVLRTSDGSLRIRIRGINTIMGSTEPLYIVDGVEVRPGPGGALNGINPSEVASISVLKGASASIYGSRAGNGVILIETQKR